MTITSALLILIFAAGVVFGLSYVTFLFATFLRGIIRD